MPDGQVYSAYVTLMDWDDIDETHLVPTPSVWVNPHGEFENAPGYVVGLYPGEGRAVSQWLAELDGDFSDLFCVGKSSPEVSRVQTRARGFQAYVEELE